MGIHTLSLDDELMEKLDDATPPRGKSDKVEQLITEYLEEDEKQLTDIKIIENSNLTDNQKDVAKKLIEQHKTELNDQQWNNFVEGCGIVRKDYKDKCYKKILNSEKIPFKGKGRRGLESVELTCRCDASIHITPLSKNDGECPNCGRVIVKLVEDDKSNVEEVQL